MTERNRAQALSQRKALTDELRKQNRRDNMFNITYEIVTEESAENGEAEETGFEHEGLSLREAFDVMRWHGHALEADSFPISLQSPPRWLSWEGEQNYRTGAWTYRSLHMPAKLTPSTKLRIARIFGLNV